MNNFVKSVQNIATPQYRGLHFALVRKATIGPQMRLLPILAQVKKHVVCMHMCVCLCVFSMFCDIVEEVCCVCKDYPQGRNFVPCEKCCHGNKPGSTPTLSVVTVILLSGVH